MPPLRYRLYRTLWVALDWIFPPACAGCEKVGARWCGRCQALAGPLNGPVCPTCGHRQAVQRVCARCVAEPPAYLQARGWGPYEGVLKQAIQRLKYRRDVALGDALAQPLIELLGRLGWAVELVLPVPLGPARLRERGYNQAALLAYPIALYHGLEYNSTTLARIRETRSQVDLSEAERKQNVSRAFQAKGTKVAGRAVLLVDDVSTTGSTLQACAAALAQAGAATVHCLTLAVADREPHPPAAGARR